MTRAIRIITLLALLLITCHPTPRAAAGPVQPRPNPPLIGDPDALSQFWHDQRWTEGDYYACALYAQASLLESFGYAFAAELAAARELGIAQEWYADDEGAQGLGQPLRAHGIAFVVHGSPDVPPILPERALWRLQLALSAGQSVIVNIDAPELAYYRGSHIKWRTIWITGLRLDAHGLPAHIVANDSYRGPAVEYPVEEFLRAWGNELFNYYGIFVTPPTS
ncbi:MAG: hypothetical protein K8S97_06170 [Anaerolineae bacterium]|nr:hypothetical protein [Anaerolineae bacterium]